MTINPKKIFRVSILLIATIISLILVIYVFKHISNVSNLISKLGFFGPIISILLYGVLSVSPVPSDPLSAINGALYGPVWGSLISWVGNNFAALIEYYVGKNINIATDFTNQKSKLPFGLNKLPANSPYLLIFGRMIPQYGSKAISLMAGIYNVPIKRYLWTTAVTNLVGSVAFALSGFGLMNLI